MAESVIKKIDSTWKLLGSGSSVQLPSNWSEVLVIISYTDQNENNWSYDFLIPNDSFITNYSRRFFKGYFANSGSNYATIFVSNNSISFINMFVDGVNQTTMTAVRYYYR